MPKLVKTPKTRREIQAASDARRGIKPIGFKVPIEFAEELDALAKSTGLTKNIIIMQAVRQWAATIPHPSQTPPHQ